MPGTLGSQRLVRWLTVSIPPSTSTRVAHGLQYSGVPVTPDNVDYGADVLAAAAPAFFGLDSAASIGSPIPNAAGVDTGVNYGGPTQVQFDHMYLYMTNYDAAVTTTGHVSVYRWISEQRNSII